MDKETKQKIINTIFKEKTLEEFKISIIESIKEAKSKNSIGNILLNAFEISQMDNLIKYEEK